MGNSNNSVLFSFSFFLSLNISMQIILTLYFILILTKIPLSLTFYDVIMKNIENNIGDNEIKWIFLYNI